LRRLRTQEAPAEGSPSDQDDGSTRSGNPIPRVRGLETPGPWRDLGGVGTLSGVAPEGKEIG